MIGNDIIDIFETRRVSNWKRAGFIEKLFSTEEQSEIKLSIDPFTTVWKLWSMKESAYKVFIQAGGKRFFNPSIIECKIDNSNIGQVKISGILLKTNTLIHPNYIFSSAVLDNTDVDTSIFRLSETNSKHLSNFIHQQLLNNFANMYSLKRGNLQLLKTEAGVPVLYYNNQPLNYSISITHQGQYGAYSILNN